jgi:hypothetical protein
MGRVSRPWQNCVLVVSTGCLAGILSPKGVNPYCSGAYTGFCPTRTDSGVARDYLMLIARIIDKYSTWLKGKLHPGTGHEDPEGEQRYSCALPGEGWWPTSCSGRFNPGKKTGTHCTGCWVGTGTVRTGVENLASHRDSICRPSSP